MESSETTWRVVSNTVANRMIDLSLIHKLIPSRRVRRRNKAINTAIKQFHGVKTYSQYIQIKTSVLRNMSDDKETDSNSSFSVNDYNILYKSDSSSTNCSEDFFDETKADTNENDIISDIESRKSVVKQLRGKRDVSKPFTDNTIRNDKHWENQPLVIGEMWPQKYSGIEGDIKEELSEHGGTHSEKSYNEMQQSVEYRSNEGEFGLNAEETNSPLIKKRLQKLKRLNLAADSDSSLSEDESACHNIATPRNKLLKRSKQCLFLSNSDYENGNCKQETSIHCDKRCRELNETCLIKGDEEKRCSRNITRSGVCNELVEAEEGGGGLILEKTVPIITFKDTKEHELFIIDIPSVVLENQLVGKKIVLTEKKLKLGEDKYKVEYKDKDNVTCVFASGKTHKPYKTVNIKLAARVVARKKVSPT